MTDPLLHWIPNHNYCNDTWVIYKNAMILLLSHHEYGEYIIIRHVGYYFVWSTHEHIMSHKYVYDPDSTLELTENDMKYIVKCVKKYNELIQERLFVLIRLDRIDNQPYLNIT